MDDVHHDQSTKEEKQYEFGEIFRFITPILIIVVGYLTNSSICDMKYKLEKMDTHFTNHLQHHQDLEVGYERRLSTLESKQCFFENDGE